MHNGKRNLDIHYGIPILLPFLFLIFHKKHHTSFSTSTIYWCQFLSLQPVYKKQMLSTKKCILTSSDHGGSEERDSSASWSTLTFLGRNMTTKGAIFLAMLKRKYLHRYRQKQCSDDDKNNIGAMLNWTSAIKVRNLTHHVV